jgi:hypothetical protein
MAGITLLSPIMQLPEVIAERRTARTTAGPGGNTLWAKPLWAIN